MTLLKISEVSKSFGGLLAINDVSLEIEQGEFIGIVGPNGSGKTTLFNLISGMFYPDQGSIIFQDRDITRLPSYKRAPLGIGRTFQIPRPFNSASVLENIAVGAMFGTQAKELNMHQSLEVADEILHIVGLDRHRDKPAGILTPVEKKLMEIARALAMKPKLLLMDEAMAGMHPGDISKMVTFIKDVAQKEGIAIVAMVEHIMRAVADFAARVIVLHQGSVLCEAPTEEALQDPRVIECYLGHPPEEETC